MATLFPRVGWSLLLAVIATAPVRAVEVRDVRIWTGPDSTRLVLDLSARAAHRIDVLRNPDRVVVDVPGGRLRHGVHAPAGAAGAIRRVRIAQRGDGHLRLTVDVAKGVQAKSFLTPPNARYGYRLFVDFGTPAAEPVPVHIERSHNGSRDLLIAVDAGHGGDDPGAIGQNGTREKDVVLAIARDLAQRIDAEPGMKSMLTRDGDYFVPLRDRMRRARARNADLFVSVHADSVRDRNVDGSSVYILSQRGASDEASRWLAERENASDLIGGVSLEDKGDVLASVLLDLSQSAALEASEAAATRILRQLGQVGQVRKREVQQARFMVLKSPDIPSMLVETAYISNPAEEQKLRGGAQQARLAAAIHAGLRDYFYANPPQGTRIAQLAAPASTARNVAQAQPSQPPM